jgi:hypothetical protein
MHSAARTSPTRGASVIDLSTASFARRCERLASVFRIATNCRAAG